MKIQMQLMAVSLIAILYCSSTYAASAAKSRSAIKPGEYLKSDYIAMIEKSHSPYTALRSSSEPTLLVAYKGEYDLVLVHFFHEFHDGLNIRDDGRAYRLGPDWKDSSSESFSVDGDNLTFTDYNSHGPLCYIYVGNAKRFVAKKVIVGDYVDAAGMTYSFREDGTAQFGDVLFPYEIGLDFVLRPKSGNNNNKRDYFRNSKSLEIFEYEIKDGVMSIYRTSGEEAMDVESEPFLKIKKVSR
jgi:hypothetical protein